MIEGLQMSERARQFWIATSDLAGSPINGKANGQPNCRASVIFANLGWHWGTMDDLLTAYSLVWDLELEGLVDQSTMHDNDVHFVLTARGRSEAGIQPA